MVIIFSNLLLAYVSLVAQVVGGGVGVARWSLSAVVVVVAVRWFSGPIAAVWALLFGLLLDGLGAGPLGLHAATLIVLTALLPRMGFVEGESSPWRWGGAVCLVAWWDRAICAGLQTIPRQQWEVLEDELLEGTVSAALTGLAAAVCAALVASVVRPRPAARRG